MHLNLVHIILLQEDKVLLLKRQNTGAFDGLYALPGGKREDQESLEEATAREAFEDLGITTNPAHIQLLHQSIALSPVQSQITYFNSFLQITQFQDSIRNAEPHKCGELKFYALSKLPRTMIPFVREGLAKALQ